MAPSETVFVPIPFIAALSGDIVGQDPCIAPQAPQLQLWLQLLLQLLAELVATVLSATAFVPIPFIAALNGAIAGPVPFTVLL